MTTRDIENNLRYGLIRGHFSKNDFRYNVFERKDEHTIDTLIQNQNINTPTVMCNRIEFSNQNMCVERNEPIANKDTYICDVRAVRYILDCDRNEQCNAIINQGLATSTNSYNADCVHDDDTCVPR